MAVITDASGGASIGGALGGTVVNGRVLFTNAGLLAIDDDFRFDGVNASLGGAIVSGRRLTAYLESSGVGIQVNGFANNQDSNILLTTPDARLLIPRVYGGTTAGSINGVTAAALAILEGSNCANMLLGGSDIPTLTRFGANNAGSALGVIKTVQADAGNVGAGLDVIATLTNGNALLFLDGMWVRVTASVRYAANGNAKRAVIRFGSTIVAQTAGATVVKNGGSSTLIAKISRVTGTTQRAEGRFEGITFTAADPLITTPGETLSGGVNITVEGEGAADNDVVLNSLLVEVGYGRA